VVDVRGRGRRSGHVPTEWGRPLARPGDFALGWDEPMQEWALSSSGGARTGIAALTLGALGVVFGDIGTSPLYAFQSVFFVDGGVVHPTPVHVYGAVSLVFWTITLIVSVKYVTFVMRADNDGEGGIMALVALVQRTLGPTHRATAKLVALGGLGAALFYGDSAITPALSVLS